MPNAFQFRSLLGRGSSETEPSDASTNDRDELATPPSQSRAKRTLQIRENLDELMRQVEHARHDADQMIEEMSALEIDAGMTVALRREIDTLREKLDEAKLETLAETAKSEGMARELARLRDDLSRLRGDYEKSQREVSAMSLDAERTEDRLRSTMATLNETKRDLEIQREGKEKAEVDAACLRANLTERDRAQTAMMQQESELRMQAAKLQTQYDEVAEALARKERSLLEKKSELETQKDLVAEFEADAEMSRDELRLLNNKYSDLKVSQEARVYSLNDGLNQEREGHQMTRKLLEEARANNQTLSDENGALNDQKTSMLQDNQQMKRELSSTRSQIREYGDKLKEAHLRYAAAQSDIQRLEASLEDAKKEAVSLRRQASKSEQLLRENTDLHDKMSGIQQSLDRYRAKDLIDDGPIVVTSSKTVGKASTKKNARETVAATNQNVARIRRR